MKSVKLILSVIFFYLPHSYAGTITEVKHCLVDGTYPDDCTDANRPDDQRCSIIATSDPLIQVGRSQFRGRYSIPALKKVNSRFRSSIRIYYPEDKVYGVASKDRKTFIEWMGEIESLPSGRAKISFDEFYYRAQPSTADYYLEYHCVN